MNQRTYRNLDLVVERTDISPRLDVEQEWQRLQQELGKLQAEGILTLERLPSATVDALQSRLCRPPAVLHPTFCRPRPLRPHQPHRGLVLEDDAHRHHLVAAAAFSDHDVEVYVRDNTLFAQDDSWLIEFGSIPVR